MFKKLKSKNLVKQLREDYHLTQDEFAKKIFVSRQLVSSWENNTAIPNKDVIKLIHREFNISYFKLFFKYGYGNLLALKIFLSAVLAIIFFYILITNIAKNYMVNVYVGKFENPEVTMTNSFFIETKNRKSLYLGSVVDSPYEFDTIKIYYRINGKSFYIYQGRYRDDLILDEPANYHEYFKNNFDLNELYVDLINEKLDLILTCKFNYEKVDYYYRNYSQKEIGFDNDNNEIATPSITIGELEKNGYEQDKEDLLTFVNGNYNYNTFDNTLIYHDEKVTIQMDTTYEVIELRMSSNGDYVMEYYSINNGEVTCCENSCKFEEKIKPILEEYNKLHGEDN